MLEQETMGSARDAVIVVRSAPPRLQQAALTQFGAAVRRGDGLAIGIDGAEAALRAASTLRRSGKPSIGVAAGEEGRAARLAEQAAPGQVLITAELVEGLDPPGWMELAPGPDGTTLELGWASAGPTQPLSLPGPVALAVDQPWPMLGREAELERVASAWRRAVSGERTLELIAGEPGAGKTRLAAEAAAEASRAGGLALYGSGEGPDDLPYAPFAEAVSHLLAHGDAELLAGLADSPFGRLAVRSRGTTTADAGAFGDDRATLFSSATTELERLSERTPLLLVVDDLHACSPSALRLLHHLVRTPVPMRLLVLATYRPAELSPSDQRAELIGRLRSTPASEHLELLGLEAPALRGIAAALEVAGDETGIAAAAAETLDETAGNALFACELLRHLGELGGAAAGHAAAAPQSLQMLIASRAASLGEDAYEHLTGAAVAGRSFELAIVAEALGIEVGALRASMEAGERVGLVSHEPDAERYSFSHAITARCLYESLPAARRGALHRRLAEVLEASRGTRAAPQLADHWLRAVPGDSARAARFSALAGSQALARYDHEAAAARFEDALRLQEMADVGDEAVRCDALIGLGTALRFSGEGRFREILLEACRLADRLGDDERLAAAALANNRGFPSAIGDRDLERVAMLELAGERITERSATRALLLAQHALELTFSPEDALRRRRLAQEALGIARECDQERVLSRVLLRYLMARWRPDDARDRIAAAQESIGISAKLDEPLDLFHGLHWQAVAQVEVGLVPEAARTLREQQRLAERTGDGTASWLSECSAAMHLALAGQLDEAEQRATQAVQIGTSQPDALPVFASQLASIRWQQGRLPELAPVLADALTEHPGLPAFRSLVSLAHALAGEREAAEEVLAVDLADSFAGLPQDPTWLAATVTYAHAIAELDSRDAAEAMLRTLEPHVGILASTSVSIWGLVEHAVGRLELTLGRLTDGRRSLRAAIAGYHRLGAPVWAAQAAVDLALSLTGEGPHDVRERARLLAESERVGVEHGAALLLGRAAVGGGEPSLASRVGRLGLTSRQSEVLTLVARGRTNSEIAQQLQISVSTVKRHLENVFEKTGVRSRGALTALVLEDVVER